MSTENLIGTLNFSAGQTKLGSYCCKNSFVATRRYWKASFTETYLIEMYNFWSEHENWVHLAVKSCSSLPVAPEKLVLLNCRQTGSAMNRQLLNRTRPS
jgi:hypothetical protein